MNIYRKSDIPEHLHKYFKPAEIGLERTPDEYVNELVQVFREVRRVLRKDGVLFLNLGDSYYGSSMTCGTKSKEGSAKRMGRMFEKPSNVQHEDAYDTSGKAPADYQESGCLCENLCDVCREVYLRTSRTYDLLVPMLTVSLSGPTRESMGFVNGHSPTSDFSRLGARIFPAIQRLLHCGGRADEQLRAIRESMPDEFSRQLLDLCWQRGNSSACLLCGRSLTDNVQGFAHMSGGFSGQQMHIQNNALHDAQRGHRSQYKDKACGYCNEILTTDTPPNIQPYCTTNKWKNQLKPKDLVGIPWMVAFALRADGWYLRQDIIWSKCLSGGTVVYARTQKGEMPMLVKDMVRLDPSTVELWNGEKWTRCVSWTRTNPDSERKRKSQQSRSARYRSGLAKVTGDIEIELINGQKIGCTKEHRWPTLRGVVSADQLKPGDILQTCTIPEPEHPSKPENLNDWIGWFIGLYIAEGSRRPDGCIQIASHMKETGRFEHLRKIAASYGGTCRMHQTSENGGTINVYSPVLCGILDLYVSGKDAKTKHLSSACWRRSNTFLRHLINSYLEADAHYDEKNRRYKLGFCKNDNLSTDLRTLAARLGYSMRLHRTKHKFDGREFDGWRGDCVFDPSRRRNPDTQIRSIRQSRARVFWDIAVEDEPHLFALACGTLTHNSNPMPESVKDRCTKAHEYLFLLTKSERYFYDVEAIKEPAIYCGINGMDETGYKDAKKFNGKHKTDKQRGHGRRHAGFSERWDQMDKKEQCSGYRNKRSVWTIATKPFSGAKLLADYVGVDGKPYKVSPDCPIHAHHERYQKSCTPLYDEQREEMPPRMFDNDDCLGQEYVSEQKSKTCHSRAGDSYENAHGHTPENIGDCKSCVDRSEHTLDAQTPCHTSHIQGPHGGLAYKKDLRSHECFEIANEHNTENHKTDHDLQTFRHGISCAQNPSHIPNIELPGEQSDLAGRNYGSNASAPCSTDNQNSQMACRNEHIFHDKESLSALNITSSKLYCTCRLVSTDHFATFPPALIEPCIKAGCPEGGIVLDPFMGAGTTAVVAKRLNCFYVGIELNPAYIDIAERRIKSEPESLFAPKLQC